MRWNLTVHHPISGELLAECPDLPSSPAVVQKLNEVLQGAGIERKIDQQQINFFNSPSARQEKGRKKILEMSNWLTLEKSYHRSERKPKQKTSSDSE
jgi:hypothetical protein